MLTGLPLAKGAEYTQPTSEAVYTVGAFIEGTLKTGMTLDEVPLQQDSGTLRVPSNLIATPSDLTITPIKTELGMFGLPTASDEFRVNPPRYIYPGPAEGLNYAFIGFWSYERAAPYIWGIVSGGSTQNFALPTTRGATYCGFANSWAANDVNPEHVNLMSSPKVTITTKWLPSKTGSGTLKTLSITSVGESTSTGGFSIAVGGTSTVMAATYGTFGALNGGGATALEHFYGPGTIQLSGSFSGTLEGSYIVGGLFAQMVPGNPGSCP